MALLPKQKLFLAALVVSAGNIIKAAQLAQMSVPMHYHWMKQEDEEYEQAFLDAKMQAAEVLEAEAIRRAHDGVRRPVVSMGRIVTVPKFDDEGKPVMKKTRDPKTGKEELKQVYVPLEELTYSDSLMQTLLKGNLSHKYRERSDVNQINSGTVNLVISADDAEL